MSNDTVNTDAPRDSETDSVVRIKSGQGSGERLPLFYIDDELFTIPKRPRPNIGLKYLKTLRTSGNAEMATAVLLNSMLGDGAYDALSDCDELEVPQLEEIVTIAKNTALGGLEQPTKNS